MNISTEMPMAGYFIYRSGEQSDPTSSLEFLPPKDSDELFFALKAAYPLVKTHSERMRDAVIEFLVKERDEEQIRNQMPAPTLPMDSTFDVPIESPWSSWPSMDSSTSTLSSPDLFNLATPASMSPSFGHAATMSRQNSQTQAPVTSTNRPGLEQMTGVFSLSSASQPKTRVRRKMTESEKAEYRKRRIVKACDACSKRKRKCIHNQSDMEKVQSAKVTKNKAPASTAPSAGRVEQLEKALAQPTEPSGLSEDPFIFLDQSLFGELLTEDYSSLVNDMEFQDLLAPKIVPQHDQVTPIVWPWSNTPDFTLLDTPQPNHVSPSSPVYSEALFPVTSGLLSSEESPLMGSEFDTTQQPTALEFASTSRQTPTHTWQSFSSFSRTAFSTAEGYDAEMPLFKNMGLTTPGDTASATQPRRQVSTLAPLTGLQSSVASDSASAQSVLPTETLQAVQLQGSATRRRAAAAHQQVMPLHGEGTSQAVQLPTPLTGSITAAQQHTSALHEQGGGSDSRSLYIQPQNYAGVVHETAGSPGTGSLDYRTGLSQAVDGQESKPAASEQCPQTCATKADLARHVETSHGDIDDTAALVRSRTSSQSLSSEPPRRIPGTINSVIISSDGQGYASTARLVSGGSPVTWLEAANDLMSAWLQMRPMEQYFAAAYHGQGMASAVPRPQAIISNSENALAANFHGRTVSADHDSSLDTLDKQSHQRKKRDETLVKPVKSSTRPSSLVAATLAAAPSNPQPHMLVVEQPECNKSPSTPTRSSVKYTHGKTSLVFSHPDSIQLAAAAFMLSLATTWRSMVSALMQALWHQSLTNLRTVKVESRWNCAPRVVESV